MVAKKIIGEVVKKAVKGPKKPPAPKKPAVPKIPAAPKPVQKFDEDFFDAMVDDAAKLTGQVRPSVMPTRPLTTAEKEAALVSQIAKEGREVATVKGGITRTFKDPKVIAAEREAKRLGIIAPPKVTPTSPVVKAATKTTKPKAAPVKAAAPKPAVKPAPKAPAAKLTEAPKPVKKAPVKKEAPKKTATKTGSTAPSRTPAAKKPVTAPAAPAPAVPVNYFDEVIEPFPTPTTGRFLTDADVAPAIGTVAREAAEETLPGIRRFGAMADEVTPTTTVPPVAPAAEAATAAAATRAPSILSRLKPSPRTVRNLKRGAILTGIGGAIAGVSGLLSQPSTTETAVPTTEVPPTLGQPILPPIGGAGTPGVPPTVTPGIPSTPGGGAFPPGSDAAMVQQMVDDAINKLVTGQGTKEDADVIADAGTNEVNQNVNDALNKLIESYGSEEAIQQGVEQQDPLLIMQLAGIEADYQAGLAQIKESYAAALELVGGYQDQANMLLADANKNLAASFEAAAMGLQGMGMSSGIPEYTALEGGLAGISDTALGGAGITGAALARGMSGAAQAQGLVQQLELGTELGGQLAAGRLTQADLEAALAREALGARTEARTVSAERQAAERLAREEQARQDAQARAALEYERALQLEERALTAQEQEQARQDAIAQLRLQAELDMANRLAGMSPEERRAFLGQTGAAAGVRTPSWFGTRFQGAGTNTIQGLTIATPAGAVPVTVDQANVALDNLDASIQQSLQDPTTLLQYWAEWYNINQDSIPTLRAAGRPTTAAAMVRELVG